MRVAVILDKSGTIVKAHRVLCEIRSRECFLCEGTLRFAAERGETLVNVRGRVGDILKGNLGRMSLKVSCSPEGRRGTVPKRLLNQPWVIESLKVAIGRVERDCGEGLGVCAGLLVDADGRVTHAVALGGEIYSDVREALAAIRSGGDDVFLATGNCKSFSLRCALSLRIPKEFVLYDADPKDKMELVKRLKNFYGMVVMVGNDINDLVAMSEADVGVLLRRPDAPAVEGLEKRPEVDHVLYSMNRLCGVISKIKEPLSRNTGRGTRGACGASP